MSYQLPLPSGWLMGEVPVAVVGAGGTGSQVCDQLATLSVTLRALGHPGLRVTVFDPDAVSEANIGRQRFSRADVGRNKAQVLTHRINLFHSLGWTAIPDYFSGGLVPGSLVIGCVDTVDARMAIGEGLWESPHNGPSAWWLDCGNSARNGHVILGGWDDEFGMIPTWADLFPDAEDEPDEPSCSLEQALRHQSMPVNARAAHLAIEMLYQWFRTGFLDWHAALFEVCPPSITTLPIDPNSWLLFGWDHMPADADAEIA